MFIDNKYRKWYMAIISKALRRNNVGYVEKHHIIPSSLGGTDDKTNLVKLTAREHFVCHLLLTKFTSGKELYTMRHAVGKFIQSSPLQQRKFTSWEYSKIRENISIARTGKKHSEATRVKMSEKAKGRTAWNKGVTGIVHSAESNAKRSATMTGRKMSPEFCQKMSEVRKGHTAGMTGKKHSAETKKLMSIGMSKPKGPQKRIDICPHCNDSNVTVRHIKFCKLKGNENEK